MQVSEVMTAPIITIACDEPLSRAVNIMANKKIGAIVILDYDSSPWSIITESDIIRILSKHSNDENIDWLWKRPIHSFRLKALHYINSGGSISDAIQRMAAYRIRRLPVIDDEELMGMVTEREILDKMASKSLRR
jgi:predicted transcriptional regulator